MLRSKSERCIGLHWLVTTGHPGQFDRDPSRCANVTNHKCTTSSCLTCRTNTKAGRAKGKQTKVSKGTGHQSCLHLLPRHVVRTYHAASSNGTSRNIGKRTEDVPGKTIQAQCVRYIPFLQSLLQNGEPTLIHRRNTGHCASPCLCRILAI